MIEGVVKRTLRMVFEGLEVGLMGDLKKTRRIEMYITKSFMEL